MRVRRSEMLIAKRFDGVSGWVLTKNVGKTDRNNECVFTLIRQTDRITQWGGKRMLVVVCTAETV